MTTKKTTVRKEKPQPVVKPLTLQQLIQEQGRQIDRLAETVGRMAASIYCDRPEPGPENRQECVTAAPSPRVTRNDVVKAGSIPVGSAYLSSQLSLAEETLDKLLSRLDPLMSSQGPATANSGEAPQPAAMCEVADRLIVSGNRVSRLQVALANILERLEI